MQWEWCLPRARCGRHTITSAAAEQSRMELCELCFLLTNVAKVIFFFSESFFKMNLNWTLICIKWKEKEWSAMKKVVSGALVPKGKLCSTLPSLQLASLSAALPKTGRKPQLVPCGVGGGGWVWRTEESLISKTVCSLTWQLNKRKCRNLARRGRTFGTKNTQFLIVSFQI